MKFDQSHVGRRVKYTDRNGRVRGATIRGVIAGTNSVDIEVDGMKIRTYYVPDDMIVLSPDEDSS